MTIPESVTSIGSNAFYGCSGLTSVTIPNSVTSIGYGAFKGCSGITSITIPESVTSIGDEAFYNCSGLTSVTIGNSVTSIDNNAFYGCSGLKEVHISDLASWCNISFYYASANPLYYAHHLFLNGEEVTNLTIPSSVTSIGEKAFCGCSGLTSVTIPNSVTSIGDEAFYGCSNLKAVYNQSALDIVCGSESNGYVAYYADIVAYAPAENGFYYADKEKTRVLKYIGEEKDVNVPAGVESIMPNAFEGNTILRSATLPISIRNINESAFDGCSRLTKVIIGEDIEKIESKAFNGCPVVTIYCYAEFPPTCATDAFSVNKANCTVYVTKDAYPIYLVDSIWSQFNLQIMDDPNVGIESVQRAEGNDATYYDLMGRRTNSNARGMQIIRTADGKVKKVMTL